MKQNNKSELNLIFIIVFETTTLLENTVINPMLRLMQPKHRGINFQ